MLYVEFFELSKENVPVVLPCRLESLILEVRENWIKVEWFFTFPDDSLPQDHHELADVKSIL